MKRLGIFVIYDKDSIIDRYVLYIANELKKVTDRLVVVGIGKYKDSDVKKIKSITEDFFCRENKGYDSGAFKDALCKYIGWDSVLKYDELVLCNDTFYGPFWGFESVFEAMEDEDCDFWGLTLHEAIDNFPTHVQSYFLNFKKNLIHDVKFKEFWEQLQYPTNYDEARDFFEMAISTVFPKLGYTFATYVNEVENNANRDIPYDCVNWRSYYGTKRLKCPVMKKKRFIEDLQLSDDVKKMVDYISDNSDYDITMIWDNVIRNYSLGQLNCGYHLHHIFPINKKLSCRKRKVRVGIVAVIDEGNDAKTYIDNIAETSADVITTIIVSSMALKKYIDQQYPMIETIVLRKHDDLYLYIFYEAARTWQNSKYLLFITNRRKLDLKQQQFNEEMAQNNIWDNLLLNKEYVLQVIDYLEKHYEIGMLVPNKDDSIMGTSIQYNWEQVEENIKDLSKLFDVPEVMIYRVDDRFASNSFWIRTDILKALIAESKLEDILKDDCNWERALQSVLPFFVKKCGYLPLVVENQRYAAMLRKRPVPMQVVTKVEEQYTEKYLGLYKVNIIHFTKQCKYVYIYGAGKIADKVTELLQECQIPFDGYVVSDGQQHDVQKGSHVIREFSDTLELESCGYIVAVGEKIREEVLKTIESKGIHKIYVL